MDEFEKNYNRALRFLSYRPRSEKEIKDYFLKINKQKSINKTTDEMIEAVVEKLKKYRFLNDEEFARIWVTQRTKIKPRAWRVIQFELKQKGISEEIIQSLRFPDKQEEFKIQDDLESAKILVQRKIERYKSLTKQEIYQKLGRFLAGKGFSWDTIKKAIELTIDSKK